MPKDKKTKPLSGDTARKIWLAGIGAYGRAFSEASDQISKVTKGGGKVFDELVQKGEVIETMVSHKGKEMAKDTMDKVGSGLGGGLEIDDRIAKMRARLKRGGISDTGNIEDRLDMLEAKLDMVLELLAPKKPAPKKRAARKKPAAKKTPVKRAKK